MCSSLSQTRMSPRLRAEIATRLRSSPEHEAALGWLVEQVGIAEPAATQLVDYMASAHAALGTLPTQETIIFERFFDPICFSHMTGFLMR